TSRPLLESLSVLSMNIELEKLIELLQIVLSEKLDIEVAEGLAGKLDWSQLDFVSDVYGNLFHYWHDTDIREKDPEYKVMQVNELKKLIEHLTKQDYKAACNISFLSDTPDT
ncbi:MAG: hypothetical protein GY865_19725, partial [candidate division Zixibacteria bacterium]|nr:hypothetical protein [candidate division Zixibacteria bacterium]